MKIIAVIQARTSSSRLPNKVLMKIKNKPVLEHVIDRIKRSEKIDEVVVATTLNLSDLPIVELCAKKGIRVYCGSENDVLDRFYQLAKIINPDLIVRITADCPVIDNTLIDKTIESHFASNAEYTKNQNFPDGMGSEIFSFKILEKIWQLADTKADREHVTLYIRRQKDKYITNTYKLDKDLYDLRLTLDEPQDLMLITRIYDKLYAGNPFFGLNEILDLFDKYPELMNINNKIIRDEGLIKSLKNEKMDITLKEIL
jgi:spore coat polysaccharide biosynthesis protein SpsF (cytidylyltransferase family)